MEIFGERLKELRIEKGLSQMEVAKSLNISAITLLHYEKNQREPSFDLLVNIAKYLALIKKI